MKKYCILILAILFSSVNLFNTIYAQTKTLIASEEIGRASCRERV